MPILQLSSRKLKRKHFPTHFAELLWYQNMAKLLYKRENYNFSSWNNPNILRILAKLRHICMNMCVYIVYICVCMHVNISHDEHGYIIQLYPEQEEFIRDFKVVLICENQCDSL